MPSAPTSPVKPASPLAAVEGFSKELECVICNTVMIDPRVLDCQHAMCLRCIFGVVKRDRGHGIAITCPFHCDEKTRPKGDIRTLKRNPMIGNLCQTMRERAFRHKTHENCDWCDAELWGSDGSEGEGKPVYCQRCGSISCAKCAADSKCDHAYLCTGMSERSEYPIRVLPALLTGRMCLSDVMVDFAQREKDTHAVESKTVELLELDIDATPVPSLSYVLASQADVHVQSANGDVGGLFSVTLIPDGATGAARELEDEHCSHAAVLPSDTSPELAILAEVAGAVDILQKSLGFLRRALGALARTVHMANPTTAPQVRSALAVAQLADSTISTVSTSTTKALRRLVLVGHLLNIPHIERLTQRASHATDALEKKALGQSMVNQIRLALSLSERVYDAMGAMVLELDACEAESSDLVLRCHEAFRTAVGNGADVQHGDHGSAAFDGLGVICDRVIETTKTLMNLDTRVRVYVTRAMDNVLHEVTPEPAAAAAFAELAPRLKQSLGHVRIVCASWATIAAAGAACGVIPPDEANQPLTHAEPLTEEQETVLQGVDQLVVSLCPQIADFRNQHFQMIEQAPFDEDGNRRLLLQQLSSLIIQALDLFCKEELMRAQAHSNMFMRVRAFERALDAAVRQRRDGDEDAGGTEAWNEGRLEDHRRRTAGVDELGPDEMRAIHFCEQIVSQATTIIAPSTVSEDDAAAMMRARGSLAPSHAVDEEAEDEDEGEFDRRLQPLLSSTLPRGSAAEGAGVVVSSLIKRVAPLRLLLQPTALSDKLRDRALVLARKEFKRLMPDESKPKATLCSTGPSGQVLIPVASGVLKLRLAQSNETAAGSLWASLRRKIGLSVPAEPSDLARVWPERERRRATVARPTSSPIPIAEDSAAADAETQTEAARAPGPSVDADVHRDGLDVHFAVGTATGIIVQEPLPLVPLYEQIDKLFSVARRPTSFVMVTAGFSALGYAIAAASWVMKAGQRVAATGDWKAVFA